MKQKYISKFSDISINDIDKVGGKNASLGEMINNLSNLGINVPDGFATTSEAYKLFIKSNSIDKKIQRIINELDVDSIKDLASAGRAIRKLILEAVIPEELEKQIFEAHKNLTKGSALSFAVRSSATAEDLPTASFAGQQETYLNITGFKN